MPATPPRRWKSREEYSTDEVLAAMQAANRAEPAPRPETDRYKAHRSEVLRAGGLDDEAAEAGERTVALENMTPQQHLDRMRADR